MEKSINYTHLLSFRLSAAQPHAWRNLSIIPLVISTERKRAEKSIDKARFICRFPQAGVPRQSVVGYASSRDVARNDKEKTLPHITVGAPHPTIV